VSGAAAQIAARVAAPTSGATASSSLRFTANSHSPGWTEALKSLRTSMEYK